MSRGAEGERFLAALSKLKAAVGDDPAKLDACWQDRQDLQSLCDELADFVRGFEAIEEWSPLAFTNNVSAASTHARREYDERWRETVWKVANRKLFAILDDLLADLIDTRDNIESADLPAVDLLGVSIAEWKDEANDDANRIEQILDYAFQMREMDDCGDREWIDDSLIAWDRLKISGLDIAGTLWRRRSLPHILVPIHVAKHYGEKRKSLHRRLHQAGKAFVFGAPLAALAMQRAVMEEVLSRHWGADKGWIRDAKLPELSWEARADRLKNLANDALHNDPEKLSPDELDRSIIQNFLLLRQLIEHAPENLSAHSGKRA